MKEIKGTTRVCGLIGNPVAHSISPLIHNTLAKDTNIDMAYVTFPVERELLGQAVRGAYGLNILGLNVTVPYKNEIMASLTDIDPIARTIGAVNTLVRTEEGYKGYNTDILGLQRQLKEEQVDITGNKIVILGAGGAARAIAFLCEREKASEIYILNRSPQRAYGLANEINNYAGRNVAVGMDLNDYVRLPKKKMIVIQTTSAGLYPQTEMAPIEDEMFYENVAVGVDIIYNPSKTKFMRLVEKKGGRAYNGLKMLLYQGISSFELWNHIEVEETTVRNLYDLMKKELKVIE